MPPQFEFLQARDLLCSVFGYPLLRSPYKGILKGLGLFTVPCSQPHRGPEKSFLRGFGLSTWSVRDAIDGALSRGSCRVCFQLVTGAVFRIRAVHGSRAIHLCWMSEDGDADDGDADGGGPDSENPDGSDGKGGGPNGGIPDGVDPNGGNANCGDPNGGDADSGDGEGGNTLAVPSFESVDLLVSITQRCNEEVADPAAPISVARASRVAVPVLVARSFWGY